MNFEELINKLREKIDMFRECCYPWL